MKLSVSAYRAHASAHKKILSQQQFNYGSTAASSSSSTAASNLFPVSIIDTITLLHKHSILMQFYASKSAILHHENG